MYKLNITQKKVLRTLLDNKNRDLEINELSRLSGVNTLNTERAVEYLLNIDYVFAYPDNNKLFVSISLDGESAID